MNFRLKLIVTLNNHKSAGFVSVLTSSTLVACSLVPCIVDSAISIGLFLSYQRLFRCRMDLIRVHLTEVLTELTVPIHSDLFFWALLVHAINVSNGYLVIRLSAKTM